jgi:hypothetical protein
MGGEEELSPASVGSRAGGDNRKRVRSAQRRVGPKPNDGWSPCAQIALEGELSLVQTFLP